MLIKNTRIDKFLSNMGVGSRREIQSLIRRGFASVDGKLVKDPGEKIDPINQIIEFEGKKIDYEPLIYFMLNKPGGYITATKDKIHKTVMELVPGEYRHYDLFPVGRLDIDTTGLLLLTNDGEFSHKITSPRHDVDKVYLVKTDKIYNFTEDEKYKITKFFEDGVDIGSHKCKPSKLVIISENTMHNMNGTEKLIYDFFDEKMSNFMLTISEGKFHQVKRMFESYGLKVKALKRIKIGSLLLDEKLPIGKIKKLNISELPLATG